MIMTSVNRRKDAQAVRCCLTPRQRRAKRLFDIVASAFGLVLLSPVFLCVYVALKLQAKGSVIYRQERIGLGGKPFNILKFRTMTVDAESDGPQLEMENDPRLTPVGRFLRRRHLDELPQLWNVLRGDMSMVGYRPERSHFIAQIMQHDARYECLYQMRPGITSEATLYNGYTDTMDKMLERLNLDLHYLETASMRKDLGLILRTFGVVW